MGGGRKPSSPSLPLPPSSLPPPLHPSSSLLTLISLIAPSSLLPSSAAIVIAAIVGRGLSVGLSQGAAAGVRPAARWDGSPWPDGSISGGLEAQLSARYLLVQLKADWVELSSTLGFPTWQSFHAPCFLCACNRSTMFDFTETRLESDHWGKRERSYEDECTSHEIRVNIINEDVRDTILEMGMLHFARNRKARGRVLAADIAALGLKRGDRLEPSSQLSDTNDFESRDLPFTAVFWRPRVDERGRIASWTLRRNPLFHPGLGTTPDSLLHLDTLHCLYLGVFQSFVLCVLLAVIKANIFNVVGPAEVKRAETLKRLFNNYKKWCKDNEIPQSYQLSQLTPAMIGANLKKPELKTKAAETGVLLRWAVHYCGLPGGENFEHRAVLLEAGNELLSYMDILRANGLHVEWADCQKLLFHCLRHLTLMEHASNGHLPKNHMFVHITQRVPTQGNPRFYSTFLDETLNLSIAHMASASHKANWEIAIFQRARLLPLVQKNSAFAAL